YPYLRSNIADTIGRAGFQPIPLAEINFHALYEQRLAAAMEQQCQAGGTGLVMPDGSKATH
ncbi:protein-export chaperone SecB, partial [Pseudomonas sp. BGM005]|nr:protein-export chaperone SecB [Pseudomonas sp. BG5]